MAESLPVQLITPHNLHFLDLGPQYKRSFLDWGVFHVEHSFSALSRSYQKVLRQRNALLKSIQIAKGSTSSEIASQLDYWTNQLSVLGITIDAHRKSYWESFEPLFKAISKQFLPELCKRVPCRRINFNFSRSFSTSLVCLQT